jgi:hypothetical protein
MISSIWIVGIMGLTPAFWQENPVSAADVVVDSATG